MATTIQLTEIPQNETVTNRVFTLERAGGDFGSSFDCTFQLPDRSGQVAAIHGRFVASKHHMNIEAVNGHKINVNGAVLASGRMATIEDGTVIQIADYMMLVSQIDDEEIVDTEINQIEQPNVHFTLSGLRSGEKSDDLVMNNERKNTIENYEKSQNETPHFAAKGVFSDDPFEDDPFADEEINLKHQKLSPTSDPESEKIEVETQANSAGETTTEQEVIYLEKSFNEPEHSAVNDASSGIAKVEQLAGLLNTQIVKANEQQSNLLAAIDKTLTTFLEEFSPQHLEDIYEDFAVPFFVQKEKQYWVTHRKSFNRRLDKGEYHRLFKALLIENMQKKD